MSTKPKMETMETRGNGVLGNTRPKPPRTIPSKRWCFTFHDYKKDELETMETIFKDFKCVYIIGKEHTKDERPHLQGYVEAPIKIRPVEKFKFSSKIHWEKAKGTKEDNYAYCSKEGDFTTNIKIPRPLIDPLNGKTLHDWQQEVVGIISSEPDGRSIYWYHESKGNVGKSSLVKHICMNYNAIMVSGKGNDIKYGVASHIEKHKEVDIVLIDFPRSSEGFISYTSIEEILNGNFFCAKYESKQVLFNPPHVICFANFAPDINGLHVSKDRWKVKQVE